MTTEHRLSPLGRAKVGQLIDEYYAVSAVRDRRLFEDFLCNGFEMISLSSVESRFYDVGISAKMYMGMLIVLCDDLADNPRYRDPELLRSLYHLNVDCGLSAVPEAIGGDERSKILSLAHTMFGRLRNLVGELPNGESLLPVLAFDIEQFYQANRYAELISGFPEVANLDEARVLGPITWASWRSVPST